MNQPGFTLNPISPHIGAIVEGTGDLRTADASTIQFLRDALDAHHLLVIRDQSMTAAELRTLTSQFGPLFVHHDDQGVIHADGLKEVLEMRKEPDGDYLFGGADWHTDVSFRSPEGYASFLHAKVLPPLGGDTLFNSCLAAYAALSPGMKTMLDDLQAVHSYWGPGRPDHPQQCATHAVVRTHPTKQQKSLYINRMFATRFEGMTESESRPIIDFLDHHISNGAFGCRISWEPGQLVIWDNRFTLHYPCNDFSGHLRLLIRCTAMCSPSY